MIYPCLFWPRASQHSPAQLDMQFMMCFRDGITSGPQLYMTMNRKMGGGWVATGQPLAWTGAHGPSRRPNREQDDAWDRRKGQWLRGCSWHRSAEKAAGALIRMPGMQSPMTAPQSVHADAWAFPGRGPAHWELYPCLPCVGLSSYLPSPRPGLLFSRVMGRSAKPRLAGLSFLGRVSSASFHLSRR